MKKLSISFLLAATVIAGCSCKKSGGSDNNGGTTNPVTPPANTSSDVAEWVTTGDQTSLLKQQTTVINFSSATNNYPSITVDTTQRFQQIDGFGFTLTGGSADLIYNMVESQRASLLNELFSLNDNGIGISYLRVSLGASDLSAAVFSYDDMPAGQTDVNLANFSLSKDTATLIPLLKLILAINPNIKILASPWSAPVWMKDNNSSVGGSLQTQYYAAYANYFVKYIQAMKARGITIDAITPQNEPLNPNNNPSMVMTATQQAAFIKGALGPALQVAALNTKIIVWDHNADVASYPIDVMNDAAAKAFVDGSAFHLYAGDINALTSVHNAHPDKHLYFTEQYTASTGDFSGDLKWHVKNVIIGATRNWCRNALEWNLANNPSYGPHTNGGCTTCKGALTISTGVTRNVSYYIIAHASRFVTPGSLRIQSNTSGSLSNVAFVRPDGKKVLIVENDGSTDQTFNIQFKGRQAAVTLAGGAVATYVW
jgi:glucosylceramidase